VQAVEAGKGLRGWSLSNLAMWTAEPKLFMLADQGFRLTCLDLNPKPVPHDYPREHRCQRTAATSTKS